MGELGRRELQLMEILWRHGPLTAQEILECLSDNPANATVRTMLRILERKGYVRHAKRGRAFVFGAAVRPRRTLRAMMRKILDTFFDGSPEALVAHLVDEKELDAKELDKLLSRRPLNRRKGRRRGGASRSGL